MFLELLSLITALWSARYGFSSFRPLHGTLCSSRNKARSSRPQDCRCAHINDRGSFDRQCLLDHLRGSHRRRTCEGAIGVERLHRRRACKWTSVAWTTGHSPSILISVHPALSGKSAPRDDLSARQRHACDRERSENMVEPQQD